MCRDNAVPPAAGAAGAHRLTLSRLRAGAPAIACAVVALTLAGCARPTGDFGRAAPSVVHDDIMPKIGKDLARQRGEPVSDFNLTDNERTMRDMAWSLIRPMNARDWQTAVAVEQQRTRLSDVQDVKFDPRRYYAFLQSDKFVSSEARWERVINDIRADTGLIRPFVRQAERVKRDDAERMRAVDGTGDLGATELVNATARVEENHRMMAWAARAVEYRIRAYGFAIERLAIETPSPLVAEARVALDELVAAVALGDFEAPPPKRHDVCATNCGPAGPSRYKQPPEEPVPQK